MYSLFFVGHIFCVKPTVGQSNVKHIGKSGQFENVHCDYVGFREFLLIELARHFYIVLVSLG